MKKFLAFVLSLVMFLLLMGAGAAAEDASEEEKEIPGDVTDDAMWGDGTTIASKIKVSVGDGDKGSTLDQPITITISGTVTVNGTITIIDRCFVKFIFEEEAKLVAGIDNNNKMLQIDGRKLREQYPDDYDGKSYGDDTSPHVTLQGDVTLIGKVDGDSVMLADGSTLTYIVDNETTKYHDVQDGNTAYLDFLAPDDKDGKVSS